MDNPEQTRTSQKIVEVEWFDAQSSLEIWTLEELQQLKPRHTFSVGYLLVENKDFIILGFTDFGNGLIKHSQIIPRTTIKKITEIRN